MASALDGAMHGLVRLEPPLRRSPPPKRLSASSRMILQLRGGGEAGLVLKVTHCCQFVRDYRS